MKGRVAILTNLISPYRAPLFAGIGKRFGVTIGIGIQESNRPEWDRLDSQLDACGVEVREMPGLMLKLEQDRFFHLNPGYLGLLFKLEPDGVISCEMGFRTLCAVIYTTLRKKPLWIWSEGTCLSEEGLGPVKKTVRRLFARSNARWITFGKGSTAYVAGLGVDCHRIVEIQNGVDQAKFGVSGASKPLVGPRPVVLVVGQLVDRKGLDQLFASIGRLQSKGYVFTVRLVGSGPKRAALETLAAELKLNNVQFAGGVRPEDVPLEYRAADALILPTLKDVWGLVANEALLCGLPVTASKYAGCAQELLDPPDIFDPNDPTDLDRALLRAIQGELGAPRPDRIWSMDRIVDTLCADLEKVLCRKGSAPL